ncbi:3912_t:CDS:2 [Paraglomus brasilianum]|uniref:3912_t:CDS:1 n=1 Tax=Paraglomus brasilianum TaxID=144538 RepID=A0A9N9CHC3_9GLOM|nr:3912_t:CDS:2 [Paraglomus brasilianum]
MAETQFEERPQELHSKYFVDSRTPFSAETLKPSKLHDAKLQSFAEKQKSLSLSPQIKFTKPVPQTPEEKMDEVEVDTTIPDVESLLLDPLADENVVANHRKLTEEEKRAKLRKIFSSSCSNGNLEKVVSMLKNVRSYIDINAQDEDGITPLIYAACFGHGKIAETLLEAGSKVDIKDKSKYQKEKEKRGFVDGWTPLMWATNNNHSAVVTLLLDHGADAGTKSTKGHTVFDFVPPDNHKIAEIFIHNPQRDIVFNIQPSRSKKLRPVPANVIFLSARFAHYFSSQEMLETLLDDVVDAIEAVVKARPDDMSLQSFWISNCTLLLYYLKKDKGLAIATYKNQSRISNLLQEIYFLLIRDAERRLERILEPAMIEFETIPLGDVRFEGEWRILRSLTRRSMAPPTSDYSTKLKRTSSTSRISSLRNSTSSRRAAPPSPTNITSLLSATMLIMQAYDIHPTIIEQVFSQLYYYITCEIFNRILAKKKYICRSRAMQVRLNISVLEDWVRTNNLPASTTTHFQPLIQLLQLLQCWSQMSDFIVMVSTTNELKMINPAQLKRVLKNYRYEVKEPRLPEECQQYILQLEEDTERRRKRYSMDSMRSNRSDSSSIIYLSTTTPASANGAATTWDEDEEFGEQKDSEALLALSLPTSAEMLSNFGGKEKENEFIPVISDEWMEKLDMGMRIGTGSIVEQLTSQWEAEYNFEDDEEDDEMFNSEHTITVEAI